MNSLEFTRKFRNVFVVLVIALIFSIFDTVSASPLKIAVGLWIPPYVIRNESKGIEFDILKEVLASQGYQMQPVYVPLARTLAMFKQDEVDGVMSTGLKNMPGCYTDSHITYWNFAISLTRKNLKIDTIMDLRGKSIVGFQNAKNYLGDAFHKMATENSNYKEFADQRTQIKVLFGGRTDVIVADRYIFEWFRNDKEVENIVDTSQHVTFYRLFEPSHFSAVFKSNKVCKDFNIGLKKMRDSGRYEEIISSYITNRPS
ncbi:MAG: transporter substrate-binding domain-containing protein [Sneathiella sp.]